MTRFLYILLFPVLILISCSRHSQSFDAKVKKSEKSRIGENYFCEGMKFYTLGNIPEAENWFKKSYEVNANDAGLNFILAKVSIKKNDFNQGLFYAERAVKLNEKNVYYQQLLADIYEHQNNLPEAIKIYKKLITLRPKELDYYLELAALYLYQKNEQEAISIYNQAEEKFGKSPEISRQKQELFLKSNKVEEAIAESKSLMEAFPEDNSFRLSHAELLIKNGRVEEAKGILNNIIKADPDDPYAHFILAGLHRSDKNYKLYFEEISKVFSNPEMALESKVGVLKEVQEVSVEANDKKQFSKIASILPKTHPDLPLSYLAYGDVLYTGGEKKEAWKQFLKAKELDETNYELWNQLLMLDSELKETDSMIVHSEKALEIFPNQASFWYFNGTAYMLAKKHEEAIEALEQGKKLAGSNPQLQIQFYSLLGDNYNEIKDFTKADMSYEEALKLDMDNPHVLNNYSYFLSLRNEKLPQALEMSEKLIKLSPENPAFLDTHGWVLYKLGRLEEAKKNIEKALKSANDGTIVEHYGDILFKLGEKEKAVEEWKNARKLGQVSENIDRKILDKKLYE